MAGLASFAYAQTRIQSRYGERADAGVWLKLHNILDLGSYLQTAQQTALRPWVLGLSSTYNSHDIEQALRQKYRQHVDEVASWMPVKWHRPLQWIKRLADLPTLQYLLAGGEPLEWMKSDPEISDFTGDDVQLRVQHIRTAGNQALVDSWQQHGSILSGWLSQWKSIRPESIYFDQGQKQLEKLLLEQVQLQTRQQGKTLPGDYEIMLDRLRLVFRRSAFQPAAVCAYLAIVAIDVHRLRSDLMLRLLFQDGQDIEQELPQ
jgi:hypothetical protein